MNKSIDQINILVVGDIMLDRYIEGEVKRISPEAPVPIVNVTNEYYTLGGCGNVVRNIRELGANVDCIASIGNDKEGQLINQYLIELGARSFCFVGSDITTLKERIISDERKIQMLRVDREDTNKIDASLPITTFSKIEKQNYDLIVISDYNKGMITARLMTFLKELKIPIIVDPKPCNSNFYNNIFMITPNEVEWNEMRFASEYLFNKVRFILVTKGKHGMVVYDNEETKKYNIESEPVKVYNVSGAGDTAISVISVCIGLGIDVITSAKIANKCAGYVVTQPGTCVVPKNKFISIMKQELN